MNRNELQLLAELSDPDEGVVRALGALDGDLILLGAGGKMGYGLSLMALRAFQMAGKSNRVIAVSRFNSSDVAEQLRLEGITTISCDLLDVDAVRLLPEAANVVSLVGQKFGTSLHPAQTWATNTIAPANIAQRYCDSQIVVLSSGNVYPLTSVTSSGASESTALSPVGEYGQTAVGRERIFEHFSQTHGTPMTLIRLNYANEPRYGVLVDIALKVRQGEPIDVTMGHVNAVWATDVNRVVYKCFELSNSPPAVINVAGPQVLKVRDLALAFGEAFGMDPVIIGHEAETALLSDASKCWQQFGGPEATTDYMIRRIASWIMEGYPTWDLPTGFQVRSGAF